MALIKKVFGWLLASILAIWAVLPKLIDWVGRSTLPEDWEGLMSEKLPAALQWLFSTPWWVPGLLATILTGWLIWASWPRATSAQQPFDAEEMVLANSSQHSDDAPATAPDRASYYDLLSFTTRYLLPACDALIDLQKTMIETAAEDSPMRDLAIAGMSSGSNSQARDFWRNYFTLEQQINQSEPTLKFSEMIRCIRSLELRGYGQFKAETASFARKFDEETRKNEAVVKAADEWVVRHNSLVEKYEAIRTDPRFSGQNTDGGSLFWPRKRNGFGAAVVRRDQLLQLEALGPDSRKALE